MASPNTEALRLQHAALANLSQWRTVRPGDPEWGSPDRDRSLRGKARRKARKAAQRAARQ
jgi:hypothetical protein